MPSGITHGNQHMLQPFCHLVVLSRTKLRVISMNNNGTHHIQHAQAGRMITEYIKNETQGKNSACIMYNTRTVNFLWNVWKLGGAHV